MSENTWSVYRHTFPDGKKYIGITKCEPVKRWKNGSGYSGQPKMYQAIIKYGWNHIEHEIVKRGLEETEAKKIERELVEREEPNNLYNNELFSNGRIFSEKKEKTDYCVGAGTNMFEIEELISDIEYEKLWSKIGKRFVNFAFKSDKVVVWYCNIENDKYVYVELEALYPECGVKYSDFGRWVANDAVFIESTRKETKIDMNEAKRLFGLSGN